MLLEGLLQHEVSIEYEMCHGLIHSWKLMDWCWVHNNFQLCAQDGNVEFSVAESEETSKIDFIRLKLNTENIT